MDTGQRSAWEAAVEAALDGASDDHVRVPADVLIAVDAELRPPGIGLGPMVATAFLIGVVAGLVATSLYMAFT